MATQRVTFVFPEELEITIEELSNRCGISPIEVVRVGLQIFEALAKSVGGIKFLRNQTARLKPGSVN